MAEERKPNSYYWRRKKRDQPEVVSCKYCGTLTRMVKLGLCEDCWEIKWRAEKKPWVAEKIIADVLKQKGRCHAPAKKGWRKKVRSV